MTMGTIGEVPGKPASPAPSSSSLLQPPGLSCEPRARLSSLS